MDWWLRNRKNVGVASGIISAVGVVLWLIFTFYNYRRMQTQLVKQDAAIRMIQNEAKDISTISRSVSLLQEAQCLAPWITSNEQASRVLGCPIQQQQQQQPRVPVPQQQASLAAPRPSASMQDLSEQGFGPSTSFQPLMPNYGYFGPFGTSSEIGMPAFQN